VLLHFAFFTNKLNFADAEKAHPRATEGDENACI